MLYIRILKYLKKCLGQGILYSRNDHLIVKAYIDACWAGSKLDRSSTTGHCITLGAWKSKKQSAVAKSSSIKALHQAMARTACELLWLQILPYELGFLYKKEPNNIKFWQRINAADYNKSSLYWTYKTYWTWCPFYERKHRKQWYQVEVFAYR